MIDEVNTNNNLPEDAPGIVDDLLGDSWPEVKPEKPAEADPESKVEGQPEKEPKPEEGKPEGEVKVEPPKPEAEPKPEVKAYEYKGRQYTLEQMQELGILEDVFQTARQFPGIQQKYQTLLEKDKVTGPAPAGQSEAVAPRGPSGEQILSAYGPVMEQSAKEGYIEAEAYEAFPRLVSALMFHRDLLYDVRQAVATLVTREVERDQTGQRSAFQVYLDGVCGEAAKAGEHFNLLIDPEVRKGFYEYLGTLHTPSNEVDVEFIKRQWIAYNSEAVMEAVRQTASERKVNDDVKRRNAKGEGGSPRPAPAKEAPKDQDTKMLDSFLEGDKRFSSGG